jgi:sarcosine oxidase subunit alpha
LSLRRQRSGRYGHQRLGGQAPAGRTLGGAIAGRDRAERVEVHLDGRSVLAIPGTSVASLLLEQNVLAWRYNLVTGELRGPFCGMGICFECELTVDGQRAVRACGEPVRAGMVIETELGAGRVGGDVDG